MLYQLSYAHHRLIANSLTLFFYAASVCMFAIEGSVAISRQAREGGLFETA
jgi:hypothetical protein